MRVSTVDLNVSDQLDIAYIAGLFDGEGCITYKQYMRKRKGQKKAYPTWSIRMEIAMTDRSVLIWLHEVLGCLLYTSPSPRDAQESRMPSSA